MPRDQGLSARGICSGNKAGDQARLCRANGPGATSHPASDESWRHAVADTQAAFSRAAGRTPRRSRKSLCPGHLRHRSRCRRRCRDRADGGQSEVLNVTTLPTFGARWLIPRLNGYRFRHPGVYLNIANRVEPFDFEEERVDVAFFFGHGAWPKAECIKLLDETMVPVCAPTAVPDGGIDDPLALTDLVLLQSATRPEAWHDWFEAQGCYTTHSYHGPRFDTFYMALSAARAGCGVTLVPRFLVEEELATGQLAIPWSFSLTSRDAYYLAYPEHKGEVAKVRGFIDWILEHLEAPAQVDGPCTAN